MIYGAHRSTDNSHRRLCHVCWGGVAAIGQGGREEEGLQRDFIASEGDMEGFPVEVSLWDSLMHKRCLTVMSIPWGIMCRGSPGLGRNT